MRSQSLSNESHAAMTSPERLLPSIHERMLLWISLCADPGQDQGTPSRSNVGHKLRYRDKSLSNYPSFLQSIFSSHPLAWQPFLLRWHSFNALSYGDFSLFCIMLSPGKHKLISGPNWPLCLQLLVIPCQRSAPAIVRLLHIIIDFFDLGRTSVDQWAQVNEQPVLDFDNRCSEPLTKTPTGVRYR